MMEEGKYYWAKRTLNTPWEVVYCCGIDNDQIALKRMVDDGIYYLTSFFSYIETPITPPNE